MTNYWVRIDNGVNYCFIFLVLRVLLCCIAGLQGIFLAHAKGLLHRSVLSFDVRIIDFYLFFCSINSIGIGDLRSFGHQYVNVSEPFAPRLALRPVRADLHDF